MEQTSGLNRNTIDKYYTTENTVQICIELIKKYINIGPNDLCIEPSAGNGSFIKNITKLFSNYKFYDISPENNEIIKQDYLSFDHNEISTEYNNIHIIGNPPFGRQSSLAKKFIKKSAIFSNSISFILPKSFKKDSLKKTFPLNYHLICEQDLPDNSFTINNNNYNVPCVFQIWIKKDVNRILPKKLFPNKFKFVKKDENPDICFRRVGVYAGKIDKKYDDKSVQSHYFIKFDIKLTDDIFEKLTQLKYKDGDNTVGPKSISKQELIKEFNMVF